MIKTFEQFNNNQDIDAICKMYNITNYIIRPDGKVDVEGDVNLYDKGLTKLPLEFGKVSGNFRCYNNNLTSLEGSPKEVEGLFSCSYNNLLDVEDLIKCRIGRLFGY